MDTCKYRNNPFNIRYNASNNWKGQTEPKNGFCTFSDMKYGVRAAFLLVYNYRNLHDATTPRDIIRYWAPKEDGNDTSAYIAFVGQLLIEDEPIDTTLEYLILLYSMWKVEQGWVPSLWEFATLLNASLIEDL